MLDNLGSHWSVRVARVLAVVWAGFWIWFGLASGLGEGLDPLGVLMHTVVPGGIFGLLAILAWRREALGGSLLLAVGILAAVFYPLRVRGWRAFYLPILLTMALPPLVAGGLLLWHRYRGRADV